MLMLMHINFRTLPAIFVIPALMTLFGCGQDGPTTSTGLDAGFQSGTLGVRSLAVDEEFNCTNLDEVHVRFSDPGSIENETATLFFSYRGVPDGIHTLDVFWDEDGAPELAETMTLADATTPNPEAGKVDIEGTVEHTYDGIEDETERTVRVLLTMNGMTGNCATVRRITLTATPPEPNPCRIGLGFVPGPGCRIN